MPPRRRLDSLTTPREPRYNLRPRSTLVQSSSNDSINRDIPAIPSIPQRRMHRSQHSRVRSAVPRSRNVSSACLTDPTSIEYMYDQYDQVFYTPERRVYDGNIPRYTVNTNGISINNDSIRPGRPHNRRYTNDIRRITSLSDDYTRDIHTISVRPNECTDVIPNITTLSRHYTHTSQRRTPPRTLTDALYYAFDDIIQPIKTYITSTQLICVIVIHVILTLSIYWRLYSTSFSFRKHITTPPYYWVILVSFLYTNAVGFPIRLFFIKYVIPRCYTCVILDIPSYI